VRHAVVARILVDDLDGRVGMEEGEARDGLAVPARRDDECVLLVEQRRLPGVITFRLRVRRAARARLVDDVKDQRTDT
jgi:hypothetical protein